MRTCSICAAFLAVFAVLGSVLHFEPDYFVRTFTWGTIHRSPRLYLKTGNGGIGILQTYRRRAVNVTNMRRSCGWATVALPCHSAPQ
jgi:hypothetical protein